MVAALVLAAAVTAPSTGFAFGRVGGSIRPYTITVAVDGRVRAWGPVEVGRAKLTLAQLADLNQLAVMIRFAKLPAVTACPDALPDVAATFVRVGGRTVRVHGTCVTRYQRLFGALARAVRLRY